MLSRRNFLKVMFSIFLTTVVSFLLPRRSLSMPALPTGVIRKSSVLSVITGKKDIKERLTKLLAPLGGIVAFVSRDSRVLIKPNAGWSRTPEQAANTDPELVRAMIELCYEAGDRKSVV
jgi:hypothetical protein